MTEETTLGTVVRAAAPESYVSVRVLYEPEGKRARPAMPLSTEAFVVGRSEELAGLVLRDPRASRKHAVLRARGPESAVVEDLSSNGTFVNGARVQGEAALGDGDVVRIGDSFLLVRVTSTHPTPDADIPELQGRHTSMSALRYTIAAVAPTEAKVLITGETGTGKELVARAIHDRSGRTGRFVAVNCAAIPEALAENELFGHVAGAYTGARGPHDGFVRAADGGTLFLDEVGELPPKVQPKLLRALEDRTVVAVGTTEAIPVDIRLISATHRELIDEVDAGNFREDLYARLAGYLLHTTPLRDRKEDILPLLRVLLGEGARPVGPELVQALLSHRFRFNVRELKEIATQLLIDGAQAERLTIELVAHRLELGARDSRPTPVPAVSAEPLPREPTRPERRPAPSRDELVALMAAHQGNISRVARDLGRSRRQVHRYLGRYGIAHEDDA